MSYILDALKKAEAERQMGHVPHLYVQGGAAALPDMLPFYRKKPFLMALLAAAALGCGIVAWYAPWQATSSNPPAEQVATAAQQPAPPSPLLMPPVAANTVPQVVAVSPVPQAPKPPRPEPAKPKRSPPPAAKKAAREPVAPAATASAAIARPTSETSSLRREAAHSPEASSNSGSSGNNNSTLQAGSIADLPEQIRRELPNVVIGGYLYSDNARERQLLVNKRLLREGEEAAPGVVLEKMQPKAAVFNYKGYRYRLAY